MPARRASTILIVVLSYLLCGHAVAGEVPVDSSAGLVAAIQNAAPGDVITLAGGTYSITGNVSCGTAGTAERPIVVRAATLGDAILELDAVEGFKVQAPFWTFENLVIKGVCADDSTCEHAFHIVGEADNTVLRNNRVSNFNAHVKANGEGDPRVFPDDVLIERNELFSDAVRDTANPVTPLDIVGGRRWVIRSNYIHDFAKGQGNNVSYAAFLKGNSRDGLFERNLVVCEMLHTGQIRLGLSFGGGGSSPDSICEDGTCTPEHQNGVMRNNIIVNCPSDVGIYVNEGQNVRLLNNTLFNTTGIDVRFAASSAELRNNLLNGQIRQRDGATAVMGTNATQVPLADLTSWFADPSAADFALVDGTAIVDLGEVLVDVTDDYCGTPRVDGAHDIGAVEYVDGRACDTSTPFRDEAPIDPPLDAAEAVDTGGGPDTATGDALDGVGGLDTVDGGVSTDASTGADSATGDLGMAADAVGDSGQSQDGSSEGCGCVLAARQRAPGSWVCALVLVGLVGLRRRRHRVGRHVGVLTP